MAAGARRLKGTFTAKSPDSPTGIGSSQAAGRILPVLIDNEASSSAWELARRSSSVSTRPLLSLAVPTLAADVCAGIHATSSDARSSNASSMSRCTLACLRRSLVAHPMPR